MRVKDVEGAKRRWVRLTQEDDLGFWWLADDVRELLPGAQEEEIRRETLAALRSLMKAGVLFAADQLDNGEFEIWDGSVDEQLARIDAEWAKLPRQPTLGDVAWIVGPRRVRR